VYIHITVVKTMQGEKHRMQVEEFCITTLSVTNIQESRWQLGVEHWGDDTN
jgi:hypothetical protein